MNRKEFSQITSINGIDCFSEGCFVLFFKLVSKLVLLACEVHCHRSKIISYILPWKAKNKKCVASQFLFRKWEITLYFGINRSYGSVEHVLCTKLFSKQGCYYISVKL